MVTIMVEVLVKGLGGVKKLILQPIKVTVNKDGATVEDVLCRVASKLGDPFIKNVYSPYSQELADGVFILLNGRKVEFIGGLKTKVKNGDVIAVGTVVTGG